MEAHKITNCWNARQRPFIVIELDYLAYICYIITIPSNLTDMAVLVSTLLAYILKGGCITAIF